MSNPYGEPRRGRGAFAAGAAKRLHLEDALEQGGPAHPDCMLADAMSGGLAIDFGSPFSS